MADALVGRPHAQPMIVVRRQKNVAARPIPWRTCIDCDIGSSSVLVM